ncbi:hypothetical protein [Pseudarthrobacter sp. H2]|uniref:hypothetical protein n=1 Tax=Pseudarthrobacter sp. H2 TaxID=3418415 RepID=UPI003CE7FBA8
MPPFERRGSKAEQPPIEVDWPKVMEDLLNIPGEQLAAYSRFRRQLSLGNQALLMSQGLLEPFNTYRGWGELGRQVKRGAKAKAILRPIQVKNHNAKSEDDPETFTKFKLVHSEFGVSDTEGDDLPEYEPLDDWRIETALGRLAITEVPYQSLDGNSQGHSFGRNIAINPLAAYPFKTRLHEIAHVELGHTTKDEQPEDVPHARGHKEFEAEATAVFTIKKIGASALTLMNESASRNYVQGWLKDEKPTDRSIQRVFSTSDRIYKAGLPEEVTSE